MSDTKLPDDIETNCPRCPHPADLFFTKRYSHPLTRLQAARHQLRELGYSVLYESILTPGRAVHAEKPRVVD